MKKQTAVVVYSNGFGFKCSALPMEQFSFFLNLSKGKKTEPIFIGFFRENANKLLFIKTSRGLTIPIKLRFIPALSPDTHGVRIIRFKDKKDKIISIDVT